MWVRVELPEIVGPVTGFTFPRDDVLYVLTPGGLVRVTLAPVVGVRPVADAATLAAAYGPRGLAWDGGVHFVYDADGGDVTPCDHPNGDRIVPDRDGTLLITDPAERVVRQRIASIRQPAGERVRLLVEILERAGRPADADRVRVAAAAQWPVAATDTIVARIPDTE